MARTLSDFQCPKCRTDKFKVFVDLDAETMQAYGYYVQCPKCGTRKLLCYLDGGPLGEEEGDSD
jgi:rubredoxin